MLAYVQARGVTQLVHFTRIGNLSSILRHGLQGRDDLARHSIEHEVNDAYRYDYLPNGVCLSISFPNYKMFYRLRRDQPDADWAVVGVSPEVIRDKRCVFNPVNAATREYALKPIDLRTTPAALESMFAELPGGPSRATLRIPDFYPTNPQAEVLVLERIEPRYIEGVMFDSRDQIKNTDAFRSVIREHGGVFKFFRAPAMFGPRLDYRFWNGSLNG